MNDTEISNYLYNKSLEIEPRGSRFVPKFPRKWPHLNLKSPGIKTVKTGKSIPSAVANTINQTLNSTLKSDDSSKSDDTSKSDNDFSVFASVSIIYNTLQTFYYNNCSLCMCVFMLEKMENC